MGGEFKLPRPRTFRSSLPYLLLPALLLPLLFFTSSPLPVPVPASYPHPTQPDARITIGVKAYACDYTSQPLLATMLSSIRNTYPSIRVLIANDGPLTVSDFPSIRHDPYTDEIRLPLDAGISAGRNALVAATETPLFLLLDDDHLFDPGTNLSLLNHIDDNFDIVGLRVRNLPGIPELEHSNIFLPRYIANITKFENRILELCVWDENAGPGVSDMRVPVKVDVLHNAFIARTDILKSVRWRDELKVNEHMTFFLDSKKAGLNVGYLPSVYVHHRKREYSACYEQVRGREPAFEKYLDYRDKYEWTMGCYKTFPDYVRWHLEVEKKQRTD